MGDAGEAGDIGELVEDRFDDQSFDDAPLSDPESNFDEQDLLSIDEHVSPNEHLRLNDIRGRPALSTIPEESKIDDNPSETTVCSETGGRFSDGLCNDSQSTRSQVLSIKSSDFITNQKASEILQREEESFLRGHGLFIQDDPRFDRTHFEKENSWEPSIPNQSFSFAGSENNEVVNHLGSAENVADKPRESKQKSGVLDEKLANDVTFRNDMSISEDNGKAVAPLTESNNQQRSQLENSSEIRSTPQRKQAKKILTCEESSPVPGDSSLVGAQTSTPLSMVAKLPSRQRLRDFENMVFGISMIKADGGSAKEGNQSLAESTDTTMLSAGQIQSILKGIPNGSPSTLMRELEAQRKSRVKLRKPRSFLPPPPFKNQDVSNSSGAVASSDAMKFDERSASMADRPFFGKEVQPLVPPTIPKHQSTELARPTLCVSNNATKATVPDKASEVSVSVRSVHSQLKVPQHREEINRKLTAAHTQGATIRAEAPTTRPESVRSSSSLSTVSGPRSASQMSTDSSQRSVLFIPQHEVAFGCVAIGDTALASIDVTNRTDHPLRIRAMLSSTGNVFTLLDSQIILLDAHRTTSLRIEFYATQNARYCTSLSIQASGGGGPAVTYKMPIRGVGGTAVVTVKDREDLRVTRNGSYVLQSSYESTFSFTLINSGKRHAFARMVVLFFGENGIPEQIPVDIRPAPGIVIERDDSKKVSVRLRSPLPFSDWRSSQNSIVSSASTSQQRAVSPLQVVIYWGEERTRRRLRCQEQKTGTIHQCEGLQFTDKYDGEDAEYTPPKGYPVSREDIRLFDQTLRMHIIYVCSPRIRPRQSIVSNSSLERSLQPEDTFRERTICNTLVVPDQTLRQS